MCTKRTINFLTLLFALILFVLLGKERTQDAHVLYYVPELELFIRLSPYPLCKDSEILLFSKERLLLQRKNIDALSYKYDNIIIMDAYNKKNCFYVKAGPADTLLTSDIPHSVFFPMEELFHLHKHRYPATMQQLLSELPFFVISFSYDGIKKRRTITSSDDRVTIIELERTNY